MSSSKLTCTPGRRPVCGQAVGTVPCHVLNANRALCTLVRPTFPSLIFMKRRRQRGSRGPSMGYRTAWSRSMEARRRPGIRSLACRAGSAAAASPTLAQHMSASSPARDLFRARVLDRDPRPNSFGTVEDHPRDDEDAVGHARQQRQLRLLSDSPRPGSWGSASPKRKSTAKASRRVRQHGRSRLSASTCCARPALSSECRC